MRALFHSPHPFYSLHSLLHPLRHSAGLKVLYANIPGGGMSRSASLTLNLMLSVLDANNIPVNDKMDIVDMAQVR